jgi:hypothetical protein
VLSQTEIKFYIYIPIHLVTVGIKQLENDFENVVEENGILM